MPFFLVCVLVISLFIFGCMKSGYSLTGDSKTVTSEEVSNTSRAEIEKMLKRVEIKEPLKTDSNGLCYYVGPLVDPETREYVCPVDGEKTVFKKDDREADKGYNATYEIIDMRRMVENLNSITTLAKFSLDERRMCHKCFPGIKNNERFVTLVTKYPDGKEVRYDKLLYEDLYNLKAFLIKEPIYGVYKYEIGKIQAIFGVDVTIPSKEKNK